MKTSDVIREAFAETPHPGSRFTDVAATDRDEGIYEYFVGSNQFGHAVKDLRYHSCALSFFTDPAFRYWLPTFMIAELEYPEEADIIGESIAFHLSDTQSANARICAFSTPEIEAIKQFLKTCIGRSNSIYTEVYQKAIDNINKTRKQNKAEEPTPNPPSD